MLWAAARTILASKAAPLGRPYTVTRVVFAFVLGAAIGVAATAAFYLLHHQRSWEEQKARSEANQLACSLGDVGLGGKPCAKVVSFRKTATYTWEARMEAFHRTYCYRLRTYQPPQRCTRT